ncbi:FecR family protein [Sphingomonas sp.]|uniref:FecR family protein n=1 Tax=Sphingomonas sp. TaxID=28214 RepID=UPI003D6CB8FA
MSAGPQSYNDALRSEATYWFNLKRSGDMTARDERIFLSWLDRAPAHRNAYEELEHYWAILGSVGQDPEIMAALEQDGDFYDRPSWWPRLAVIAATLLLAVTAGWAAIDSGLLGIGTGGQAEQQYAQMFETGVGERTLVTLPDGSHVTLDADSEMRVDDMRSKRAIALLRGRAFFRVAPDRSRPFIVSANGKNVRAVGTEFAVRIDQDNVVVTLVEGKVRVDEVRASRGSSHRADMTAGAQLVARADEDWSIDRVDIAKETSWLKGRLTFLRDPLSTVITEMNRYSDKKIVFSGGAVPDTRIVGVFKMGDVDSLAKGLEMNGLARITANTDKEIELSPK